MKKIALILIIFLNGIFVFAQKADSLQSKPGKLRNVDGAFMSASKDIMENLELSPKLSVLTAAIYTAGLNDNFKHDTITLFAPGNAAFLSAQNIKLDSLLLPSHRALLTSLIKYHAIAGRITSKEIGNQIKAGNGKATFTTLSGGTLTATINANRNIVLTDEMGGQSVISKFDIPQSNGILDIVTAVLIPKATP